MSDTKIFSLGDQGGSNSMAGLIASLCQNRGLDPNMVMAMMNNNRGYGGFGDMGAWWIIILLIFGWGGFGNGFGGGFNGRGTAQGLADLGNLVNNDAGRELIMSAIQGVGGSVSQLASTVHCDVNALQGAISSLSTQLCQLGNQMGQNTNQVLTAIMQGNNGLARAYDNLSSGNPDTGLCFSGDGESVLVISVTSSAEEFADSLAHEQHHLASQIGSALGWNLLGEDVCYLAGEIGRKMSAIASRYLCECCRHSQE